MQTITRRFNLLTDTWKLKETNLKLFVIIIKFRLGYDITHLSYYLQH